MTHVLTSEYWPTTPAPAAFSLQAIEAVYATPAHSGRKQLRTRGGQRWALGLEYPPMSRAEFAPIMGYAAGLRGRSGTCYVELPILGTKRGLWTGGPVLRARRNMNRYSADFGQSSWYSYRDALPGANAVGPVVRVQEHPDGATVGQRWGGDAGGSASPRIGRENLATFASTKNALSIWFKRDDAGDVGLNLRDATDAQDHYIRWEWTGSAWVYYTASGAVDNYACWQWDNDWWRFYINVNGDTNGITGHTIHAYFYPAQDWAANTIGSYCFGFQFEQGYTSCGPYRPTGADDETEAAGDPHVGPWLYSYGWNTGEQVKAGDTFQIAGLQKLYMAVEDHSRQDAGWMAMPIAPQLQHQANNGTALLQASTLHCALSRDITEWRTQKPLLYRYAVDFLEVVDTY